LNRGAAVHLTMAYHVIWDHLHQRCRHSLSLLCILILWPRTHHTLHGSVQPVDKRCAQNHLSVTTLKIFSPDIKSTMYRDRLQSSSTITKNNIVMSVSTFVDLQGFIVGRNFVVKEFAALREGSVFSHYIFGSPLPWSCLIKAEKNQTYWLIANHHEIQDGMVPYRLKV